MRMIQKMMTRSPRKMKWIPRKIEYLYISISNNRSLLGTIMNSWWMYWSSLRDFPGVFRIDRYWSSNDRLMNDLGGRIIRGEWGDFTQVNSWWRIKIGEFGFSLWNGGSNVLSLRSGGFVRNCIFLGMPHRCLDISFLVPCVPWFSFLPTPRNQMGTQATNDQNDDQDYE